MSVHRQQITILVLFPFSLHEVMLSHLDLAACKLTCPSTI